MTLASPDDPPDPAVRFETTDAPADGRSATDNAVSATGGWLTGPGRLDDSGLDWTAVLLAVGLTVVFYIVVNWWLGSRVDGAFEDARVPAVAAAPSPEVAAERAVGMAAAPRDLAEAGYVRNAFRGHSSATAAEQLRRLAAGMTGGDAPVGTVAVIEEHLTGRRSGWPGLWADAEVPSGGNFAAALAVADPAWERKVAQAQADRADAAADFLADYFDVVVREVRPALRSYARINGPIQWVTVVAFWLTVVLALRRLGVVRRLRGASPLGVTRAAAVLGGRVAPRVRRAGGAAATRLPAWTARLPRPTLPAAVPPGPAVAPAAFAAGDVRVTLDREVYGPMSHLVALLPSLGFVGTVLGMGEALLRADGLFSAEDKTAAIGEITRRLGLAFDTTLVGLVGGILAGGLVLLVRLREDAFWRRFTPPAGTPAADRAGAGERPAAVCGQPVAATAGAGE